jgi:RNA polymerase sigma-54 factor
MVKQALEARQSQSLVMTKQLLQSIELLQLSAQELQAVVAEELEKNPFLAESEEVVSREDLAEEKQKSEIEEADLWSGDESFQQDNFQQNRYENAGGSHDGDFDFVRDNAAQQKTLHQHLFEQMQQKDLSILQLKMAELLVDMVDEAGYLPLDYVQRADNFGIDAENLLQLVKSLQECEPTGVGARNLQECLSLQLAERGELNAVMQLLLQNLALIAEGNLKKLNKICAAEEGVVLQSLQLIKSCNPKPASIYQIERSGVLIPDIFVRRDSDGKWICEINQDNLPKVMLQRPYSEAALARLKDKEEGKMLGQHMQNANWLLKMLEQRFSTLLKVGGAIIERQKDFLDFGVAYLNPMTMKQIAEIVGCHESTISRVTTQKYMSTPRGNFELKYFFSSNLVNNNGGSAYSSRSVMFMIEQIIKAEAKDGIVLSDEAIADDLRRQGIEVARRTIVKYREQMQIPPSGMRKRALKKSF